MSGKAKPNTIPERPPLLLRKVRQWQPRRSHAGGCGVRGNWITDRMSGPPSTSTTIGNPVVAEEYGGLSLRFEDGTLHSCMLQADPARLVLEYTRLMMGFLLFQPAPARIAMIGLGGGSLAKYCALHLPDADFTAVEIAPEVIALRHTFDIPPDGPRFRVLCEDGADFVQRDIEPLDVLLVDGFDRGGQSEALCSPAFYDRCRERLAPGGVAAINLYADDGGFDCCVGRIRDAFAGQIVIIAADESRNNIVFAGTDVPFPPPFPDLLDRMRALVVAHPIALDRTLRKIVNGEGPPKQPRQSRRAKFKRRGRRDRRDLDRFEL